MQHTSYHSCGMHAVVHLNVLQAVATIALTFVAKTLTLT